MTGIALATVATRSHLPAALTLAESVRATWQRRVPIYVALVDPAGPDPRPHLDPLGVKVIDATQLGLPEWAWLATKLGPRDLACAVKPFLLRALLDDGHDSVLYSDSDVLFLADGEPLAQHAPDAPFVVVPHMLSPFGPEVGTKPPTMADIRLAGTLNAGLLVARAGAATREFLVTWGDLAISPDASPHPDEPREQQAFNWVTSFVDDVSVLRDPCVNVAYWNLHERPVRMAALDDRDPDRWTVHGRPVVSFHFSGFDPGAGTLSVHDQRGFAEFNPYLNRLCDMYAKRLAGAEARLGPQPPYPYAEVDGTPLTDGLRQDLRRLEFRGLRQDTSDEWPRTPRAALVALSAVLAPAPAPLVPERVARVVLSRPDLFSLFEPGALYGGKLLGWLASVAFAREDSEGLSYERLTEFAIVRALVADIASAAAAACDDLDEDAAAVLLLEDRERLIELIGDAAVAASVAGGGYRIPVHEPACCLRRIYDTRRDLQDAFPDPLDADLVAYCAWLAHSLPSEYDVPQSVAALAADFDVDGALVRILARLQRHPVLREHVRVNGLTQGVIQALRPEADGQHGFTVTDLVLAEWWIATRKDDSARDLVTPVFPLHVDATDTPAHNGRPEGINVFGHFKSPNGLGRLSLGVGRAAEDAAYRCRRILLTNATMDADLALGDLAVRALPEYTHDIVVSYPHIDFDVLDVFPEFFDRARKVIAYLAWEQRDCHAAWATRFERFDRLFALSSFAAGSISEAFGRPCDVLLPVVESTNGGPAAPRDQLGLPADAFVVGTVFDAASGFERKNPVGTAEAVARAFAGRSDVFYVLKAGNCHWPRHASRLREATALLDAAGIRHAVITDVLDRDRLTALAASFDLLVSLHRAEGFGYTIAEAMLQGVPVVATGYSGNMDYMSPENSYPVDYRETVITQREGPFGIGTVWAQADVDDAAAKCRHVYENRAQAAAQAERGRADITRLCSSAAVGRRLRELLS